MTWRDALKQLTEANSPHVLVTILEVSGSAPRAAGTKMVVSRDAIYDSVGGGGLEYRVIEHCRRWLVDEARHASGNQIDTLNINLARDAGQCCGGVVKLLLECFRPSYAPLVICGAGHLGCALVRILSEMPVALTLLDNRAEWLARAECQIDTENGQTATFKSVELKQPHSQIEQCVEGAVFLVMTHSHDLDFELCEAILSRSAPRWCGLIASRSKAASFRRRLLAKGFDAEELASLVAPIGLPDINSKEPMAVAVSVVAQLLSLPVFTNPAGLSSAGVPASRAE